MFAFHTKGSTVNKIDHIENNGQNLMFLYLNIINPKIFFTCKKWQVSQVNKL